MTTPDLSGIIPTRYKTLATIIGTGLSFVVPLLLNVTDSLPAPWPAVIGVILWVLTALGVYHAPYLPKNTVIAPAPPVTGSETPGEYQPPWPKP